MAGAWPLTLSSPASDVQMSVTPESDQHKTCEKSWETFGTKLKFPDFNLTINVMFAQLIQAIAHRKTESDRYYLFQEHTINTIETFERGEVT